MHNNIDALVTELGALVADLGKDGGQISPSIYDTAQALRFYPPPEGPQPALQWLVACQQADGGWGSPDVPYARVVPTVATLLALQLYPQDRRTHAVIDAGLEFLHQQAPLWFDLPMDALPIATEMILPRLVEDANAVGLEIARDSYSTLYQLRERKCQHIRKRTLVPGTPPTYSWEALEIPVDPPLLDHSGGIGHSPSATAAWLCQAQKRPDLKSPCHSARTYLHNAAAATKMDIPGVVPNVWPITGFEMSYGPYAILISGLFHHPLLQDALSRQLDGLQVIMERGHGVSFGEYFTPDADETAVGLAALQAHGRPVQLEVILQFKHEDHFYTFPNELNPSVFSNAHALYALACMGERSTTTEEFLRKRQGADGRWVADKWHSSWLYTTLEVLLALDCLEHKEEVMAAVMIFLNAQKADGGWGSGVQSTRAETSYALIALNTMRQHSLSDPSVTDAVVRGHHWLQQQYTSNSSTPELLWLGKELYSPYRVDRIYELGALLFVALTEEGA